MEAIVLCGGLATRLGMAAKGVPKVLLPVAGKSVLAWQFGLLKAVGVTETVLASGHLHDVLYEEVGTEYAGMRVRYAREEKPLGTGGAIRNAMSQINSSPFFVLNGDILLEAGVLEAMVDRFEPGMTGLLLTAYVRDKRPYGGVVTVTGDRVIAFREKHLTEEPGTVNGGIYLLDKKIAGAFPVRRESFSIERDVFPNVQGLYAYRTRATWIDIGVPERLAEARAKFSELVGD